jgi:glycerol-3-phosphate responsive antiterminator
MFPTGVRKAVIVPASAVVSRGQLQSVFVVEDGAAHARLVTLGERAADAIEVLSGINPGDVVVTAPPANLTGGAKVEVQR